MPSFLASVEGRRLSLQEFGEHFDADWEGMSRRFFKFECQQYYDEGDEGPYHDFVRGDIDAFVDKVVALRKEDTPFFRSAASRGTSFVRLHAVSEPLTKYLQYEFYSYVLSEQQGETILTIPLQAAEALGGKPLTDFQIFDADSLFVLDVGNGVVREVIKSTRQFDINRASELADLLIAHAKPYRDLADLDPAIEARLLRAFNS